MTHSDNYTEASLSRYLGALLYDALLIFALLLIATAIYLIPFILQSDGNTATADKLQTSAFDTPVYKTYLFIIWFGFYAWFLPRGGQTLGMTAWKIKLIAKNDGKLSLWHILLRFLASLFPWFAALFLLHLSEKIGIDSNYRYLLILFGFAGIAWKYIDKNKLTLQDNFSDTRLTQIK